jgi:GDP-L-fucose synthase
MTYPKIFVAGHRGMVGSALVRKLQSRGYANLVTRERIELDLIDQHAVHAFLAHEKPDYIFIAAAKVGGIRANATYPADFLYQNLVIEANLIHGAHLAGVQNLMFLGSSTIYPRECPQPMSEDHLLTGPLEPTNEPYALAKIAGIKLCENYNRQYGRRYVSLKPINIFGPNDHYDLSNSHVLPALILMEHEAKLRGDRELVVWGRGEPKREFLCVDDLADACIYLLELGYEGSLLNVGSGVDVTTRELASVAMDVVGVHGVITFDATKPDGPPRKLLDVSRLKALGWQAKTDLLAGIKMTYEAASFYKESA